MLTNGLASEATIQQVKAKDLVIAYQAGRKRHQVTVSRPYPNGQVGERFEVRYNKHWHDDVVVLYWRPLLKAVTPVRVHPNRVTAVRFTRGNVVEAEYKAEGKQFTRYLCLPPGFKMNRLQDITLTYDARNPAVAYYLPRVEQQN